MNFPTSPNVNQIYSLGDFVWKWNGTGWELVYVRGFGSFVQTFLTPQDVYLEDYMGARVFQHFDVT